MQALDNEFFEAYKRLDRLCADMYACRNGVSAYIEDMEQRSRQGRSSVSGWETSYKTLKHLRWMRNRIAHDAEPFQLCEEQDLQDVCDFYDCILSGTDPLTQLRKRRQDSAPVSIPVPPPAVSRRTGCLPSLLLVLGALALLLFHLL